MFSQGGGQPVTNLFGGTLVQFLTFCSYNIEIGSSILGQNDPKNCNVYKIMLVLYWGYIGVLAKCEYSLTTPQCSIKIVPVLRLLVPKPKFCDQTYFAKIIEI